MTDARAREASKEGEAGKDGMKALRDEAQKADAPPPPKRVWKRAQELVREAAGLIKKKRKKVDPAVAAEVQRQVDAVRELAADKKAALADSGPLLKASIELDQGLQRHYGQWRKSQLRELVEAILWALALAGFIKFFLIEAFSIPSASMYPTLEIGDHLFINKVGYGVYVPFSSKRMISWSQPDRGDIIVFVYRYPEPDHPSPLLTPTFETDRMDGEDFIKRVIGLPGDRVRLEDHRIILNGQPIQTESLGRQQCAIFGGGDNDRRPTDHCECELQRETIEDESWITQHFVGPGCGSPANSKWPRERPTTLPYIGSKDKNPDYPEVVVPEGHVFVMGDNRDASKDGRFWGFVPFDRIKGKAFVIWLNTGDMSRFGTWLD
ncbi:MAG: signal peptidase I [Deltaproteobacteria bacterium]|nr:signal peptidase I [Deltaproteobacteria bacterium]